MNRFSCKSYAAIQRCCSLEIPAGNILVVGGGGAAGGGDDSAGGGLDANGGGEGAALPHVSASPSWR